MVALARGQSSDCANPILDLFTQVNGVLTDVASLEFQVFDVSDPAKEQNPVQVYPATLGERATVNVTELCPAGDKLSTGHFVARYAPAVDEPLGSHEVRWFFKLALSSPEQTFREEFEVLSEVVGTGQLAYCPIQDLRNEGFSTQQASDLRLSRLIELASRYIDSVTERFFEPRQKTVEIDGRGSSDLLLDEPIIAIERVEIMDQGLGGIPVTGIADPTSYRVYNRHLTQGLLKPDDRESPKISFITNGSPRPLLSRGFCFPTGTQNIRVKGVFGYTEPDGSPTGRTPLLIREVCKRLVARDMTPLSNASARETSRQRHRIIQEKTRDQSYTLGKLTLTGALTGDPEIDNVLVMFKRPADLGAA